MAVETVILKYEGQEYTLKKSLTIREQLSLAGKKQAVTGGHYGDLANSINEGDQEMAFLADIVVQLDARIIDAPKDWVSAESEYDTKKLLGLWGAWIKESGFFRTPDSRAEAGEDKEVKSESEKES